MGSFKKFVNKAKGKVASSLQSVGLGGGGVGGILTGSLVGGALFGPAGMVAGGIAGAEKPKAPVLEALPKMPTIDDSEVEEAARNERRRYGRAATLLTGGQGLMGAAPTVRRTLLGA